MLSSALKSKHLRTCKTPHGPVGICEMQGWRTEMEDVILIRPSLEKHRDTVLLAVFDGHNGGQASEFVANTMGRAVDELEDPSDEKSLVACLLKLDAEYRKRCQEQKTQNDEDDSDRAGTTAVFAIIHPMYSTDGKVVKNKWKATIGNLGDSRAILIGKDGLVVESLTVDQTPDLPEEKLRIEAAGGFVRDKRVDADLAMSRALGDYRYKAAPSKRPEEQKVIAVPVITTTTVDRGDYLLLFCDGIVDAMKSKKEANRQIGRFVWNELKEKQAKRDPASVVAKLCDHALKLQSKDNMSAIVMIFDDRINLETKQAFLPGPVPEEKDKDKQFEEAYYAFGRKYGFGEKAEQMTQTSDRDPGTLSSVAGSLASLSVSSSSLALSET